MAYDIVITGRYMMSSVSEASKAILDLYEDNPDKWIKGCIAQDRDGDSCDYSSPRAYSFCLVGAYHHLVSKNVLDCKIYKDWATAIEVVAAPRRRPDLRDRSIVDFNNDPNTTFDDIKAVLQETIKEEVS
jgi:hypothetical protein